MILIFKICSFYFKTPSIQPFALINCDKIPYDYLRMKKKD